MFVGHMPEAEQQAVKASVSEAVCFMYSDYNKSIFFLPTMLKYWIIPLYFLIKKYYKTVIIWRGIEEYTGKNQGKYY